MNNYFVAIINNPCGGLDGYYLSAGGGWERFCRDGMDINYAHKRASDLRHLHPDCYCVFQVIEKEHQ